MIVGGIGKRNRNWFCWEIINIWIIVDLFQRCLVEWRTRSIHDVINGSWGRELEEEK